MDTKYIYNRIISDNKGSLENLLTLLKNRTPQLRMMFYVMEDEDTQVFNVDIRTVDRQNIMLVGSYHMVYAAIDGLCDWLIKPEVITQEMACN